MLAQAAKGDDGAAWLLLTARVIPSLFSSRRFLPAWHVAIVHSIRVLFDFTITSGHFSIFEDEIRGLFSSLPNSPISDHQFSGKTGTLIYFIARKNQFNPMKITQLFCC
ncbi:MAG: hypothetical protein J7F05_07780 [Trichodesmium erythraeum GBRTRLIN201]|jgi:hypothetical protein|nr:hypothetical protein [Trichodesmium erythraeum GBRTRLIN201]